MFSLFLICYRTCHDLRFCYENINKTHDQLSIVKSESTLEDNVFRSRIYSLGKATDNYLVIYKIKNNGFRFRIERSEEMSSYRFNITQDNIIVNAEKIAEKDPITLKTTPTLQILQANDGEDECTILNEPLSITFSKDGRQCITLNHDNFMFLENGEPLEDTQWNTNTFYYNSTVMNETYKHGKTAVGIDISFLSPNSRLTGFSEGTYPINLNDTYGETERRYSRDSYAMYGFVPMLTAHCKDFKVAPTIFWMNPSDMFMKVSTSSFSRTVNIVSEGGFIDLVIFLEKMPTVLKQYTALTGIAPMPPAFAFGYHQSKYGYPNQEKVEEILNGLDEVKFPHDAIWLDIDHLHKFQPFRINKTWFKDAAAFFKSQSDKNRYVIRITDPHMPIDDEHKQYKELHELGYSIKNSSNLDVIAPCWPGNSTWPDFFRKEVREWWGNQYLYEADPEGWAKNVYIWNDMNEIAVFDHIEGTAIKDWQYMNGTLEDREVHSAYGIMNTAATYEGLLKRDNYKLRPFLLTRSFFAGSQKYTWHWSGDNSPTWEHLKLSIDITLSANLNAIPFTGSDVGGFYGNTTEELLARWFQVGAYMYPFFREHATSKAEFREPYLYKNTTIFNSLLKTTQERYKLLALWYTAAYHHTQTAEPLVAPLWYEYPEVDDLHDVRFQAIVDHRLMAAPVVNEGSIAVDVVKPPGRWYRYTTGKELVNSSFVQVFLDTPVFIRGGSIIPYFREAAVTVKEQLTKDFQLIIAVDENGEAEGDLYLDDGESLDQTEHVYTVFKFNGSLSINATGSCKSVTNKITSIVIYGLNNISQVTMKDGIVTSDKDGVITVSGISLDVSKSYNSLSDNSQGATTQISSSSNVLAIVVCVLFILFVAGFCSYQLCLKKTICKVSENESQSSAILP